MGLNWVSVGSLSLVALLWGVTNPLMKKGAKGVDKIEAKCMIRQFFQELRFLISNLGYTLPFIINQIGSLFYVYMLQEVDLSVIVVVVNSLTFLFTALTGRFLGEERIHYTTTCGITFILIGTMMCCIDKM